MVNSLKITHPVLLTSVQAFGTGSVPNSAKGFWMSSSCLESFCSTQRSSLTSFFRPSIVFLTVNILCMDIWSDLNLTVASSVSCWIMAVCLSAILALHSYNRSIICFHEFWIYKTCVTIMCRNDELSSTMSWVGGLLKDSELFILFAENSQILLKISFIPILLTFIYLVTLNLL